VIYCFLVTSSELIGGFDLHAVPRVGDRICISFQRVLSAAGRNLLEYQEEDLTRRREWDGQTVEVDSVCHDLAASSLGSNSHTVRIFVTRRAK
jgi:hypothetical protein